MKVQGILKQTPEILLDSTAVENITSKAKKRVNRTLYKRLQVLRASSTRLTNASKVLREDIKKLEAQSKQLTQEQQKYLTILKKRMQ